MNVKRDELIKALKLASLGVNNKETAAQSSFFMFTGDSIVGDNEIIHAKVNFETEITGAIKAEELMSILSKMVSPAIDMTVDGDSLVFKSGRSKTGLTIYPLLRESVARINPLEDDPEGFKKIMEVDTGISVGLEACKPCCSSSLSNRALSAINVSKRSMIACDNFQAIRVSSDTDIISIDNVLIPSYAIDAMMGIQFDQLYMNDDFLCVAVNSQTKNWIMFEAIDSNEIEYPDIEFLFGSHGTEIKFPDGFLDAVKKAEVFAKNSLKSEEIYVQVSITPESMVVRGEGTNGFYEEEFDFTFDSKVKFVASPRTLDFLLNKDFIKIELINDETPRIMMVTDFCTYTITIETE